MFDKYERKSPERDQHPINDKYQKNYNSKEFEDPQFNKKYAVANKNSQDSNLPYFSNNNKHQYFYNGDSQDYNEFINSTHLNNNPRVKIINKKNMELSNSDSSSLHNTFVFQYKHRPAPPRKRKCVLLPSKRIKFFFDFKTETVVHELNDMESESQLLAKFYRDCEYSLDQHHKPNRQRSASSIEDGFFYDKEFCGVSSTFIERKRFTRRKKKNTTIIK